MYNLLVEPLIRYDRAGQPRREASLPEVYAALMADVVDAFPALRPHQRHAWHAFLVQLAAMAIHRARMAEPPHEAAEWATLLRGLTPDYPGDEPWQLVVDDITKPAFMQPPARSIERQEDYKTPVSTPDELDMLVTARNHDLKSAVAIQPNTDDWIFALVTLQTMEGYGGRMNYGISRMPSGYGNRPAFSLTPSVRPGGHVKHDLSALVTLRQTLLSQYPMTDSGIPLLWTVPWDGTKSEPKFISELEPLYIEVCRRVRLEWQNGTVVGKRATSDATRVRDAKGLTGDPWAPVSNTLNPKGTPPAFLTQRKFGYERVIDGLFSPDWKQPILLSRAAQTVAGSDDDTYLVARGMVRGEGGTAGYHERVIPLRDRTMRVFGTPSGHKLLGDIASERVGQIGKVQTALRFAVATFAAHGNDDFKAHGKGKPSPNKLAQTWVDKLDEILDASFFDDLQAEFEAGEGLRQNVRKQWLKDRVVHQAQVLFQDAANTLPCPSIRRYKARVQAESVLRRRLYGRDGIPEISDNSEEDDTEC